MELYIDHASKQFKDKLAVNDVTLNMTPGVWGAAWRQRCRKNYPYAHDCRNSDSNIGRDTL